VPVTILSRCLQFNLKPLTPALIAGHLKHVLAAEGIAFEEPALAQIAKAASGSLRDSLSLLDQAIAHGGGRVAATEVAQMLGSLGGDLVWPLLERIVAGDGKGTIAEAERIASRSVSLDTALEDLASILHRVALAQAGAMPADDDADAPRVIDMSQQIDAARVQVMYQVAVLGRRDLPLAPDEFAGFTMALLRMLSFSDVGTRVAGGKAQGEAGTPVARAMPAPVARSSAAAVAAPSEPSVAFDGDWPALVERLHLTGMAGMAARHAELAGFQNNHLELVVSDVHRVYAEKAYQDKLKAELATHFGPTFRLSVRVGTTAGASVAAAKSRENAKKQASAAEAIEDDPFVRDLVRDLGAEVVPSSIRPADDAGQPSSEKR
jgi:DNA polymerase-3 subunit gamma/tau